MAYKDLNNKLDWAMSFQRTGKFPLDRSSMFASEADAIEYAKQTGKDSRKLGGTSYVGQIIAVDDGVSVSAYIITAVGSAATLEKLGTASNADNLNKALEAKITAETTRATGVEDALRKDLTAETSRATERENALDGKIATETSRATEKENTIEGKVDAEVARSTAKDTTHDAEIKKLQDRATDLESKIVGVVGAMHFVGVSTTNPTLPEGPTIADHTKPFADGDVCLFGTKEYVFSKGKWVELGDEGTHATKAEVKALEGKLTAEVTRSTQKDGEHDNAIKGINDKIGSASTSGILKDIADLKAKDTAIDGEISNLTKKDTNIDKEIAALKEKDGTLTTDVNDLKTKVGVNTLNSETGLFLDIKKLKAEDTTIKEAAKTLEQTVTTNAATHVADIARIDGEITAIKNASTTLNADARLKVLETAKDDHETRIGNLETASGKHETEITAIKKDYATKASLDTEIARAKAAEGSLTTQITAIENILNGTLILDGGTSANA